MNTRTQLNSFSTFVAWLASHWQVVQITAIVVMVLLLALLATSSAYAMPTDGGCGTPGC
jgi:hypothetical protein